MTDPNRNLMVNLAEIALPLGSGTCEVNPIGCRVELGGGLSLTRVSEHVWRFTNTPIAPLAPQAA